MTILKQPSSILQPENLIALPRLPRDEGGPVFAEPWQAQAFAPACARLAARPADPSGLGSCRRERIRQHHGRRHRLRARCSRNAFYEFFSDKEECFLAACDGNNEQLLALLYAEGSAATWTGALRSGLGVYLRWWQDSPRIAMAYLTDLPTAGRRAIEQRDRTYEQFGLLFGTLAARARVR